MGIIHAQLLRFLVHLCHKVLQIASQRVGDGDSRVIAGEEEQPIEQVT